jgi:hypothetical protein
VLLKEGRVLAAGPMEQVFNSQYQELRSES